MFSKISENLFNIGLSVFGLNVAFVMMVVTLFKKNI